MRCHVAAGMLGRCRLRLVSVTAGVCVVGVDDVPAVGLTSVLWFITAAEGPLVLFSFR